MSLAFAPQDIRQGVPDHRSTVQALLNENSSLIKTIRDYLSMGRTEDAAKYQQLLHRNLVHLAQAADQSLLSQLRDENAPNDENLVQPAPAAAEANTPSAAPTPGAPSVAAPPVSTPYTMQQPPQPTSQPMMAPPVMQMQPSVAAMPPTSQPQMGMPMGPPQGYGYPPQGMPPAPQGIPPGQVMPGGYPPHGFEQQLMYQQQQPPQQQQPYMR
ncbi:hypothetical protein RB195_005011 [Necator americanus]|uniref:Uncharacterized protein n=2 Tax=Necator americanus TaxID=51031 RepID=A0ABR1BKR8_NECAM|nr:SSXT protein [Necator americanus]ETN86532.1 SSXT protein [Necator americanus]